MLCTGSDSRSQQREELHTFRAFHFGQRVVCVQNNLLYMVLSLHVVLYLSDA